MGLGGELLFEFIGQNDLGVGDVLSKYGFEDFLDELVVVEVFEFEDFNSEAEKV